jgi:hypothetical protein
VFLRVCEKKKGREKKKERKKEEGVQRAMRNICVKGEKSASTCTPESVARFMLYMAPV